MPIRGKLGARALAREAQALSRPGLIAFGQKRQVEEPLARIVDDIESKLALIPALRLVVDDNSQLTDLSRRRWPTPLGHQRMYVALIVKTRHSIVRLRRKVCARDPTCGQRLEYRKASAAQQAVNERGDKHSFAGVRKPGNTKPNRRIEQMAAELDERSSGVGNL